MKIIADQQIPYVTQAFGQFGEVNCVNGREIKPDLVSDCDILLVRSVTPVNADLLDDSAVQFVASATSGIDHIDLDYLQQQGIGFGHAPGSNSRSVAEYVLSALYVLAEQKGFSLRDKTIGIVGYGHVGSKLTRFLQALGIECLINDPPLKDATGQDFFCELDEVLQADIISLHVPLTYDGPYPTNNLFDAKRIAGLKSGALLINTSRGGIVDEQALLRSITEQNITSVIDVWSNEPDINRNLLQAVSIGTPHIAGYSLDAKVRATDMIYRQCCGYFSEQPHWNMERVMNNAEADPVEIAQTDCIEELVGMLTLAAYDVRSDSAALHSVFEQSVMDMGSYFDDLRKHYPPRREFTSFKVMMKSLTPVQQRVLETVGFKVLDS